MQRAVIAGGVAIASVLMGVAVSPAHAQKRGTIVRAPASTWLYAKASKRADRARSDKDLLLRVVRRRGAWLQVETLLSGDVANYCNDPRSELSRYRIALWVPRRFVGAAGPLPPAKHPCPSRKGEKADMTLLWPNGRRAGGVHHQDGLLTDLKGKLNCFAVTIADAKETRDNSFDVCVRSRELMIRHMKQLDDTKRVGGGLHSTGAIGGLIGTSGAPRTVIGVRRSAKLLRFLPKLVDGKKPLSRSVVDDYLVHAAYRIPRGDMLNVNITFVRDLDYAKLSVAHKSLTKRRPDWRGAYKVGTTIAGHRAAVYVNAGTRGQARAKLEMLIGNKVLVSVTVQVGDQKLVERYAKLIDVAGIRRLAKRQTR